MLWTTAVLSAALIPARRAAAAVPSEPLPRLYAAALSMEAGKITNAKKSIDAGTYPGCENLPTESACLPVYLAKEPSRSVAGMLMQLAMVTGLTLKDAHDGRLERHSAVLQLVDNDLDLAEALDPPRFTLLAVVALKPASLDAKIMLRGENKLIGDNFPKIAAVAEKALRQAQALPAFADAAQQSPWQDALRRRRARLDAFKERPLPKLAWRSPTRISVSGNPFYVSFPGTPIKMTSETPITQYQLRAAKYALIATFSPTTPNVQPSDDWQNLLASAGAQSLGCNAGPSSAVCAAMMTTHNPDGSSGSALIRGLYAQGAKTILEGTFPLGRPEPKQVKDFLASAGVSP